MSANEGTVLARAEEKRERQALLHLLEDLKREHDAAQAARRQWLQTVDAVRDPMMVHDAEGTVLRANIAYARRSGLDLHSLIGRKYWECFPKLEHALAGEEFTTGAGEIFISRSFPIQDSDGRPRSVLHVFEDVTARRKAELALENREKRFRALIENGSDLILVIDASGAIRYASPAAETLSGYPLAEIVGTPFRDFVHPDDVDRIVADVAGLARMPGSTRSAELRFRTKAGRWIDVAATSKNALQDPNVHGIVVNARDITARKEGEARLRGALTATIEAIAATVETRDPYTAGHQRRVAGLAAAIGREMGLPADTVEGIHFGALIHDLGKVQVPAELLAKPTKLTKLEFELIKTHPQAGYEIVKNIKFPWPVAEMVLQHHERMDGSGYPQGLKGDAIAREARVLAVADVVEAMASHRPYRPGLGADAALAEIRGKRGLWFDPEAVDACLRLFEKGYKLDGA
jgi:PAS domain S-box-containing protein/putative nucleotidyltransferase with HDIG domain